MSDWRPIETAPRNSKARLIWVPCIKCIFCATWRVAVDANERSGWHVFGGGWSETLQRATHWMELPEPPEAP